MLDRIRGLEDRELVNALKTTLGRERQELVVFLLLLGEMEHRDLHAREGATNLFMYLTRHLGLSEPSASKRLAAARMLRRHPEIADALRMGRMHLTGIYLLSRHLTEDNKQQLLARSEGATKRDIETMLATEFGAPTRRDTITVVSAPTAPPRPLPLSLTRPPDSASAIQRSEPTPVPPVKPTPPAIGLRIGVTLDEPTAGQLRWLMDNGPARGVGAVVTQAIQELFKVQHKRDPFERALRNIHRKPPSSTAPTEEPPNETRSRRTIPAAVRHAVMIRDGGRCTYVAPDGRRCEARTQLQLDHIRPFSCGGPDTVDNLRILCAAHNQLAAKDSMGRDFISSKIAERRGTTFSGESDCG
jgi:hypothetical protein